MYMLDCSRVVSCSCLHVFKPRLWHLPRPINPSFPLRIQLDFASYIALDPNYRRQCNLSTSLYSLHLTQALQY